MENGIISALRPGWSGMFELFWTERSGVQKASSDSPQRRPKKEKYTPKKIPQELKIIPFRPIGGQCSSLKREYLQVTI